MTTHTINPDQSTTMNDVYTVSDLNRETKYIIEGSFPLIWVEGEISNLARPASGHLYFTLKDEKAQVRSAMFRMRSRLLKFSPTNGMQVLIRAQVGFYEARGEFQLIAEHMEEAGAGALRRQFEELKSNLAQEGLFDSDRKLEIPDLPQQIGVITSPTGAAIRDILSVLQRRFPAIPVIVYPVPVQGDGAGKQIADMITRADKSKKCDVLILARGGGSLEDLWSFNEEVVARAMSRCKTPIACGVGHEVDVTIADFVADIRAATPSAAAELISPNQEEWREQFASLSNRLANLMRLSLNQKQQTLQWLAKRLRHPKQRLQTQAQRLDELTQRLTQAQSHHQRHAQARLQTLTAHLMQFSPAQLVRELELRQQSLSKRLVLSTKNLLAFKSQRLETLAHSLDTLSPLATLNRGYSITKNASGKLLLNADETKIGAQITTELANGKLHCTVDEIKP